MTEKETNEIISYLKKDKGVKKHGVGEIKVWTPNPGNPFSEIRVVWNTHNFGTAKPVIKRLMEVYGDIISTAGFHRSVTSPYISVPLNKMID